jgi:signal transduction histidine kinase
LEQRTRDALQALIAMGETLVEVHPEGAGDTGTDAQPPIADETAMPIVARRVAELTRDVLGCRRVSMARVDASTGLLHPITAVGLSPAREQEWWASWSHAQTLDDRLDPERAAVLRAGESVLSERGRSPTGFPNILLDARSGLLLPMRIGEDLVGALMLDYGEQDHDVSAQDEVLLTGATARLCALVLERDRLLRQWAEARASELALRATKEQMDTFLGIASHELKGPLTAIALSVQLTERRLRTVAERQAATGTGEERALGLFQELLARTTRQVERMDRLVNDLLDASRVQADKLELRPERTDLATIVREAVDVQRQAAPGRTISLQLAPNMSIPVVADPGRIEQVVTNYLTNALKYSSADRPVEVGAQITPQQARVWVRDEGPGLPPEELDRIWERFHRARGIEIQSGTGIGLGLGLHICRTIIERHQGQVGVESTPGMGSTFWFTLPFAPESPDARL